MKRLKELRKQYGMTQLELGKLIGAAKSTISLYESGVREPDLVTVKRIAEIFNVSTDYLLEASDSHGGRPISDADIRFALSGGEQPITPKQYAEIKQFAQFIRERDSVGNK